MMVFSLHTNIVITTLFVQVLLSSASDIFDRNECLACVENGCTYCKGSDFFNNPGVCACSDISDGFFGDCNDYTFGGSPLEGQWDCRFSNSNGNILIFVVPLIVIVVLSALIRCYNKNKNANKTGTDGQSSTPGAASSSPSSPAPGGGPTSLFETIPVAVPAVNESEPEIVVNGTKRTTKSASGGGGLFSTWFTSSGAHTSGLTHGTGNSLGIHMTDDTETNLGGSSGFGIGGTDFGGSSGFGSGGGFGGSSGFDTGGTSSGFGGSSGFGSGGTSSGFGGSGGFDSGGTSSGFGGSGGFDSGGTSSGFGGTDF